MTTSRPGAEPARKALKEIRKTAPLVPSELVKLRRDVTKLSASNYKLQKAVDELKKQLNSLADRSFEASLRLS